MISKCGTSNGARVTNTVYHGATRGNALWPILYLVLTDPTAVRGVSGAPLSTTRAAAV